MPFDHDAAVFDDEHAGAGVVRHREHGSRRYLDLGRKLGNVTERIV